MTNPSPKAVVERFWELYNGPDTIFQTAFRNTVFYTFWATVFKLALGMWLALLLNRHFRFKRLIRASMLLPFIIPTVLSTVLFTGLGGVMFAVLRLYTNSLFPPSALHWAMNGTGVVVGWFVHRNGPTAGATPADDDVEQV